jgi:phospholipid N-methyltransferase
MRDMLQPIDFARAQVIVELGAGNGIFTHEILRRMRPDAVLICFEIHPKFCEMLRENISDKRFMLIEDSAENLQKHLEQQGLSKVDYVVSAIPFVALPDALVEAIVGACFSALKKGGLFIQFHYSAHIRHFYKRIFGQVHIKFVPLNFPPAFVMTCKKG